MEKEMALQYFICEDKNNALAEQIIKEYSNDKEVVLFAVNKEHKNADVNLLKFVSDKLKQDRDVINTSLANSADSIKYLKAIINNKAVILTAFESYYDMAKREILLKNVGENLKNDKDFWLDVIDTNSDYAAFIGDKLKNSEDFWRKAIKKDIGVVTNSFCGKVIPETIFNKIVNSPDIMLASFKTDRYSKAAEILGETLRNDKSFMTKAFNIDRLTNRAAALAEAVGSELKKDKQWVLSIIKQWSNQVYDRLITEDLKKDKEFILDVIKVSPFCVAGVLNMLDESLAADDEIFKTFIKYTDDWNKIYAARTLKDEKYKINDVNMILKQMNHSDSFSGGVSIYELEDLLNACSKNLLNDKASVNMLLKNSLRIISDYQYRKMVLEKTGEKLRADKQFAMHVINNYSDDYLDKLSPQLKNDIDILYSAVLKGKDITYSIKEKKILTEIARRKLNKAVRLDA